MPITFIVVSSEIESYWIFSYKLGGEWCNM